MTLSSIALWCGVLLVPGLFFALTVRTRAQVRRQADELEALLEDRNDALKRLDSSIERALQVLIDGENPGEPEKSVGATSRPSRGAVADAVHPVESGATKRANQGNRRAAQLAEASKPGAGLPYAWSPAHVAASEIQQWASDSAWPDKYQVWLVQGRLRSAIADFDPNRLADRFAAC